MLNQKGVKTCVKQVLGVNNTCETYLNGDICLHPHLRFQLQRQLSMPLNPTTGSLKLRSLANVKVKHFRQYDLVQCGTWVTYCQRNLPRTLLGYTKGTTFQIQGLTRVRVKTVSSYNITSCILVNRFQHFGATCFRYVKYLQFMIVRYRRRESELSCNASLSSLVDSYRYSENINCLELQIRGYLRYLDIIHIRCNIYIIYNIYIYVCMYVYIYTHKSKFYYQHIAQQISLIYMHRRLLQDVSAISYSHFQERVIQNIKFNFVSSKG